MVQNMNNNYNLLLLGSGGCGKSAYIKRIIGESFEKRYLPTLGANRVLININYNYQEHTINILDTAGQENCQKFEQRASEMDGVIIMFDHSSKLCYKRAVEIYKNIKRVNGDIPMVLVGNKSEINPKFIRVTDTSNKLKDFIRYYKISSKNDSIFQLKEPLLYLFERM